MKENDCFFIAMKKSYPSYWLGGFFFFSLFRKDSTLLPSNFSIACSMLSIFKIRGAGIDSAAKCDQGLPKWQQSVI